MTIIEPNKNKHFASQILYFLGLLLAASVSGIYIYNLNVGLKYQIGLMEKEIKNLETSNAELRNDLYKILDAQNLSELAAKHNLISDKNPDYFEYNAFATR